MSREPPPPSTSEQEEPEPSPRYEPPALIWEEKWEPQVLAASCAHLPGQNAACIAAPHG